MRNYVVWMCFGCVWKSSKCFGNVFGFFPPLIRGDWKWGLILVILGVLTFGLSGVVFSFLYNKLYVKELVQKGFKVKGVQTGTVADMSMKVGMTTGVTSRSTGFSTSAPALLNGHSPESTMLSAI